MSSTKLSAFLDGVLETGWLAAIVVTPLFFNIYSSRVFEPDKLTTLRSIALVMAVAWLLRRIEEGRNNQEEARLSWRTPLVLPTLFTVLVYLISNIFSIVPYTSFFGSYQRLQGTFVTLSYIVIFLIILDRMRTQVQVDRLLTTLIVNSLPIALYGFVQHAKRDPLPWGGDVTRRIASNMGNAIFVAAYLIMAAPPTLSRIVSSFRSLMTDEEPGIWELILDVLRGAFYVFIFFVQVIAVIYTKSRGPLIGLLFGLGTWMLLGLIILQQHSQQQDESSHKQVERWLKGLWIGTLVLIVVAILFFFAVNPGGPLHEWASGIPAVGRLARVLEYESGTGMVRNLIWQGALDLVLPHEPLQYPETIAEPAHSDPFNAIRPLVGYGPESMILAYNPFYPPLLGHYESRTASPDRSHNETLDSVVFTGILGLIAYLWLFGSVFYLGLRWLGILPKGWRRKLFFALLLAGAAGWVAWTTIAIGPHFFGLAIPIGMMNGLVIYLLIYGLSTFRDPEVVSKPHPNSVLLMGILATFVAHFVEINFGIAIAATRTTFWALAGIFVLLGMNWIVEQEKQPTLALRRSRNNRRKKRRRRRPRKGDTPLIPSWLWPTLGAAVIGALILGTLSYDFVNNLQGLADPGEIIWNSLTKIAIPRSRPPRTSPGIPIVFGMSAVAIALLPIAQLTKKNYFKKRRGEEWAAIAIALALSLMVGGIFAYVLGRRHAQVALMQRQEFESHMALIEYAIGVAQYLSRHINQYYYFLAALLLLGGMALLGERGIPRRWGTPAGALALSAALLSWLILLPTTSSGNQAALDNPSGLALAFGLGTGIAAFIALFVYLLYPQIKEQFTSIGWRWSLALLTAFLIFMVPMIIYRYNLQPIQADIIYKQGDPWEREGKWYVAVPHYERSIQLAPREDMYYLYMGRALLEYATALEQPEQQNTLMQETEGTLLQAQAIDPLDTDHSANLARMYKRWSSLAGGQEHQEELTDLSSHYYEVATTLSPNNVIIWNEWALLYHYIGDEENFQRCIDRSLELDPEFEQTWLILADTRVEKGNLEEASEAYRQALEIAPNEAQVWSALGRVYLQMGKNQEGIEALSQALNLAPRSNTAWDNHRMLAIAYYQSGAPEQALTEAQMALQMAPEGQRAVVEDLIQQLQQALSTGDTAP